MDRERPNVDELLQRLDDLERSVESHRVESREVWNGFNGKLDRMNGNVARLTAEIGPGLPEPGDRGKRATIRERLHELEHDRDAIEALGSTLSDQLGSIAPTVADMKRERERMEAANEERERINAEHAKRWGRRRVIVVTACAIIGGMSAFTAMVFAIAAQLG